MKKLSVLALVLFLFVGNINAKSEKVEKEKKAIIQVIEDGTNAFKARDLDKLKATYVHDESTTRLGVAKAGFSLVEGWDKMEANYEKGFKNNPNPITVKHKKVNFRIRINGSSAWVIHDEIWKLNNGDRKSVLLHIMEKKNGEWKISFMQVLNASSFAENE